MENNTITLPAEYKVSEQTSNLIAAYDLLGMMYEKVYAGLTLVYEEDDALEIIEQKVKPLQHDLESAILSLITDSIVERRNTLNSIEL